MRSAAVTMLPWACWCWMLCRDDFFKQYCQDQSAEELYEQIDLLNRNLVGNQQ
jgi:hypothetical protein